MKRGGSRPGAGAPLGNQNARLREAAEVLAEETLLSSIRDAALLGGWRVYHTRWSVGSAPGFPDLFMVRGSVALAWECKSARGKLTPEQSGWLDALGQVQGIQAAVVRPKDLEWAYGRLTN